MLDKAVAERIVHDYKVERPKLINVCVALIVIFEIQDLKQKLLVLQAYLSNSKLFSQCVA